MMMRVGEGCAASLADRRIVTVRTDCGIRHGYGRAADLDERSLRSACARSRLAGECSCGQQVVQRQHAGNHRIGGKPLSEAP